MAHYPPLEPNLFFHILSRGVNREQIFRTEENYRHFLTLYFHHTEAVFATYAYCLMGNHFHLLVKVKEEGELNGQMQQVTPTIASRAFGNCLNAYAKSFNQRFNRTGSLFERPFKRVPVTDEAHLLTLVPYIHRNPQTHGFVDMFPDWPWSSYNNLITNTPTSLQRQECLAWFHNKAAFLHSHAADADPAGPYSLLI